MKKQTDNDPLRQLIKEAGLDEPAAEFSQRLARQVVTSYAYRQSYAAKPVKKDWIGIAIITALISLNGFMLVKLNPFQTQPVLCWAVGGFILAFACILAWVKRRPAFT